jgi:hypothetical protein
VHNDLPVDKFGFGVFPQPGVKILTMAGFGT